MESSPNDSIMKMEAKEESHTQNWDLEERQEEKRSSGILNVVVSGLALFSDGYNAQISMLL